MEPLVGRPAETEQAEEPQPLAAMDTSEDPKEEPPITAAPVAPETPAAREPAPEPKPQLAEADPDTPPEVGTSMAVLKAEALGFESTLLKTITASKRKRQQQSHQVGRRAKRASRGGGKESPKVNLNARPIIRNSDIDWSTDEEAEDSC